MSEKSSSLQQMMKRAKDFFGLQYSATGNKEEVKGASPLSPVSTDGSRPNNMDTWRVELDGKAELTIKEKNGKTFYVVAAEHFSKKAGDHFQQEILSAIEDPTEWLFLIEGQNLDAHEILITSQIAREKNIPVLDPIFANFDSIAVDLFLEVQDNKGIDKNLVLGYVALLVLGSRGESSARNTAIVLGCSEADIMAGLLELTFLKASDKAEYEKVIAKIDKGLDVLSNAVSAQVLQYFLRQNPEKSKIALYLGSAHQVIVELDTSQIPSELHLSDEQIEELLAKRQSRDLIRMIRAFGLGQNSEEEADVLPEKTTSDKSDEEEQDYFAGTRKPHKELLEELEKASILVLEGKPELKAAITGWADNIFHLKASQDDRYKDMLESNNSLHRVWGAVGLLSHMLAEAVAEHRNITPEKYEEAKQAFLSAAALREADGNPNDSKEAEELRVIAGDMEALATLLYRIG